MKADGNILITLAVQFAIMALLVLCRLLTGGDRAPPDTSGH